jgi:hypothetical protein
MLRALSLEEPLPPGVLIEVVASCLQAGLVAQLYMAQSAQPPKEKP